MNNQSFPHTRASNISGVRELLASPSILPPRLKADSEDTVLRGIARKSRAIVESTGYFSACLPPDQNIKTVVVRHIFFFEVCVNFRFWCTSPSPTWPEVFKLFFDLSFPKNWWAHKAAASHGWICQVVWTISHHTPLILWKIFPHPLKSRVKTCFHGIQIPTNLAIKELHIFTFPSWI